MAFFSPLSLFAFFNLAILFHGGSAGVNYEDGYTVATVFDGNKLKINPHSLYSRQGFSDLVLLDSQNSQFYTFSFPLSQESVIKEFAGNGKAGFSDGDATAAMFDKPKSFAVDLKGNVYVADRTNFAIRKISNSGVVTTIAGGYSKTGHADGPGRNATFSSDYELTFVPDICALLIVDHGHKLVRQMDLKQDNCVHSESGMRATVIWPWIAAVVVSCFAGVLIGFTVRPFVGRHEEFNFLKVSKSWRSYLMNLGRQTPMLYFGTKNAVASRTLTTLTTLKSFSMPFLSLFYLLLAFLFKKVDSSTTSVDKDRVSLLDSDNSSSSLCVSSQKYHEQLRDLITGGESEVCTEIVKEVETDGDHHGQWHIDDLMVANIANFAEDASKLSAPEGRFIGVSNVVKRR